MSAIVDFEFYSNVYMGTEADSASFPALCARALDIVGAMTRWAVNETTITRFPEWIQTLYKKAVCAQIDFLAINGLDSLNISAGADTGFTVGKVTVHGRSNASVSGGMSGNISPMVQDYLEQTGLLGRTVGVLPDMPLIGWWY